jgi:general secretion pathway protein D
MWFRFFLLLFAVWGLYFGGVLVALKETEPEVIELVGTPQSEWSFREKDFVESPAQNADHDTSEAKVSKNFTEISSDITDVPPTKLVEKQPESTATSSPEKSAAEPVKELSIPVKLVEKQSENSAEMVKISPKRINYLTLKARSLLLVGDTEEAFAIAKSILRSDPQNKQALAVETYVKQKQLEPGADFPSNAKEARGILLKSVQDTWQTPKISLENVKAERDQETSSAIFQRLNRIIIPKISLSNTPLTQAVNTLATLVEQCDSDANDQQKSGINMVVMLTQNAVEPTITLNLKNMSLDKILNFIAKASSYQFDIEDEVIVFRKTEGGILENLDTKFFKISRSAIIRMTGLSGNTSNSGDDKDKKKESPGTNSTAEEERLIKEFLQKAGVNFSSTPGSNLAFDGSQLIVTQTLRNIKRVQEILAKYEQIKQVEIETKFIEIAQGKLDELQLGWASSFTHRGTAGANPAFPRSATLGTQQDGNNNLRPLNEAFTIRNASSGAGSIVFKDDNGAKKDEIPIPSSAPTFPGGLNLGASAVDLLNIKGVISDSINLNLTLRALE